MIFTRQMTVDDAALLSQIGRESLLQSHGHSAPASIMQTYADKSFDAITCLAELSDSRNVFYVVYYNQQPAGYFKIIFNEPHPAVQIQPATKLERLYLLQEFYDKKLGHRLLQEAVDLSKAQGDKGIWLDVWKKNERAIRFYEREGFKTVGEGCFVLTEAHSNPIWVMALTY